MLLQVFNRLSLEELEDLITEQEKLAVKAERGKEDSPVIRRLGGCLDDTLSEKKNSEHGKIIKRSVTTEKSI